MNTYRILMASVIVLYSLAAHAVDQSIYYGKNLCVQDNFDCIKVEKGQSWQSLFLDETERDLVQRINRTYNSLYPGQLIAVPKKMNKAQTLLDFAPFSLKIKTDHEKLVMIDQNKLAWGAYNEEGELVMWGPISSGRDKCSDSNNKCLTLTGVYRIFSKENINCKSDIFPIGKGGAKMPYCMYFHKGFAMHGSDDIPGYRASHGCVRMFVRDAKWLNEEFVNSDILPNHIQGTKVVVLPVGPVEN